MATEKSPEGLVRNQEPRVLGLTRNKISWDPEQNKYIGKLSNVFNALGEQFNLIGLDQADLPLHYLVLARLLNFHPDRSRWRVASVMRPKTFYQRSRAIEQRLKKWEGQYDLIFQLHAMMAPGDLSLGRSYVICTDNTYALSARYWPQWLPPSYEIDQKEWMDIETEVYEKAKFVFTWSEFARQSVIQDYGIAPDRVIATGAGANFKSVSISEKSYESQIAIFVGFEFERKGGLVLMESWKQVRKKLPNAQLYMVGLTNPTNEEIPGVRWFGKVTDRQELQQLYHQSTVFVMPSIFEPWGHVFTEAMGMGLACIGNNSCAMPEIITHEETGYLVTPGDVEELSEALITLLSNPDIAARLGHQAYHKMADAGSWSDVIANMSGYIHKAAGLR